MYYPWYADLFFYFLLSLYYWPVWIAGIALIGIGIYFWKKRGKT